MARAEELFAQIEQGKEDAILTFVAARKSEELFLDFKRSADDGAGVRLHDNDRNNLAKAISGFGNSEGGVVVWGVECKPDMDGADVAHGLKPLQNVHRFVSLLEGAVSGCTVPPHVGVRSIAIPKNEQGDGYAVTLIPKSNHAPHQVVGRLQYFIRAGSDFVPTPHAVLAGMFGRVPQPHVFHTYIVSEATLEGIHVKTSIGIALHNDGPGIAADLFLNVGLRSHPGPNCQFEFETPDNQNWSGTWAFQSRVSLICKAGYRLPPESQVMPLILKVRIAPPFEADLDISGMAGAGGAPPYRFEFHQSRDKLDRAHGAYRKLHADGRLTEERQRVLQQTLFGYQVLKGR